MYILCTIYYAVYILSSLPTEEGTGYMTRASQTIAGIQFWIILGKFMQMVTYFLFPYFTFRKRFFPEPIAGSIFYIGTIYIGIIYEYL